MTHAQLADRGLKAIDQLQAVLPAAAQMSAPDQRTLAALAVAGGYATEIAAALRAGAHALRSVEGELLAWGEMRGVRSERGVLLSLTAAAPIFDAAAALYDLMGAVLPAPPIAHTDDFRALVAQLPALVTQARAALEPLRTLDDNLAVVRSAAKTYFDAVFGELSEDKQLLAATERGYEDAEHGRGVQLDDVLAFLEHE